MVLEWNDSKTDNLISLVKEFPALYNTSCNDYNNKEKKEKLWENIGKKIGTTARNCRRKWTGMCMKYHKLKEAGSFLENGEEWPWFEYMSFVVPNTQENGFDGNVEVPANISSNFEVQYRNGEDVMSGTNREQDLSVASRKALKDMLASLVSSLPLPSANLSSQEIRLPNVKKPDDSTACKSNPTTEESLTASVEVNGSPTNVNANKLFLESLVNDMSNLTLQEQYDFKVDVLVLLKGYLLKHRS